MNLDFLIFHKKKRGKCRTRLESVPERRMINCFPFDFSLHFPAVGNFTNFSPEGTHQLSFMTQFLADVSTQKHFHETFFPSIFISKLNNCQTSTADIRERSFYSLVCRSGTRNFRLRIKTTHNDPEKKNPKAHVGFLHSHNTQIYPLQVRNTFFCRQE